MQDRYVGDIGDYVKLALLRALKPGYRLGVGWWLHPDETHNRDGRHIGYLDSPGEWRSIDSQVFDSLGDVVRSGARRVEALEASGLLDKTVFHRVALPTAGKGAPLATARQKWLADMKAATDTCDLLFLDPDNGLEPRRFRFESRRSAKSVGLCELRALQRHDRCLVVYHHQTRRKGGHFAEISYWAKRLHDDGHVRVDVVRARPYSPRAYFLLNAPADMRRRCALFCERSPDKLTWIPDVHQDEPITASCSHSR